MDYKTVLAALALCVMSVQAQNFGFGGCPKVNVQTNFQPARVSCLHALDYSTKSSAVV